MSSIVRLVFSMVRQVCRVMEKDMERHDKFVRGLRHIKREMEMVNALIKDDEWRGGAVQEIRIQHLQEFAYDVQDFVEGLWEPGAYGRRVLVTIGIGMDPQLQKLNRTIDEFKERIKSLANQWQQLNAESIQIQQGEEDDVPDPEPDGGGEAVEQLVGIDGHKSKILKLLMPSPAELRVISIVGCRGVGKTAVAKAVYHECCSYSSSHDFDCVAWVTASGCSSKKTLQDKILHSVLADLAGRASDTEDADQAVAQVANPHLHDILSKKRCLVFIDDMQQVNVWKDTVDACPKKGSKSRLVVTTSVRSVTTACSSGSYVYNMQCLSEDDSKSLFWRRVSSDYQNRSPPHSLQSESESIFSKCGGLPLALTSVAKHLNMKGQNLDSTHVREVGQNLGKDYLSDTINAMGVFKGISRALSQYYDNLLDYDHKSCMLYLSIFPKCHQIKRMTLLRKLMAEGLIVNAGCKCFDELIDRCIVEPVQMCNNSTVAKRCHVPAVVMEYIIQKSVAKNVATLIQGNEPVIQGSTEACVRRLSIQSSTKARFDELDKSALRSLNMTKTELSDDLRMCKMLRLLDLEGCTGIDKLQGCLSELQLLKYLNLRNTGISMLPTKIEKLQCLETLDIRDTKVEILPIQVIVLPKLAYLFGMFRLPDVSKEKEPNKLSEFLKNKSMLHTLAGFVAGKRKGLEHVILLARNLKKVKVLFNDAPAENQTRSSPDLERASSSASALDRPSKKMK